MPLVSRGQNSFRIGMVTILWLKDAKFTNQLLYSLIFSSIMLFFFEGFEMRCVLDLEPKIVLIESYLNMKRSS